MNKRLIQILIAIVLFLSTFLLETGSKIQFIFFIISYIVAGESVLIKTIKSIRPGIIFDENFLMTIATIGAFFIKAYPEAIFVMIFYQIGEYFQDYAVDKSRKSIKSLMELRADHVNLKVDDVIKKVDPETVPVGSTIVIKAGERIPLDGIIEEGTSYVDTSALTGEALPKEVGPGVSIFSGCINLNGLLIVKTTSVFSESTVSRILDLVENAIIKKSSQEQFITKFARFYTPIVVMIGFALAIIPPFLLNLGDFDVWLYRSLTFLVVSCPCALVVSIPLSFFAGIGAASREGILVKGSNYLEALAGTETVVFDKTGTLTKGVFDVQSICSVNGYDKKEILEFAALAEAHSNHPISDSLKRAYGGDIIENRIKDVQEYPGLGLAAIIDEKSIVIGNYKLMEDIGIKCQVAKNIGTNIYVGIDGIFAGYINIADELKDDSRKAIDELKKIGIRRIAILTGDSRQSAEIVAKELDVHEFYPELLPGDKLDQLENIYYSRKGKGKIIFIGDGINDAPVLARSDVGIAMGGIGRDAAIEAADVVIMQDEPIKIPLAIRISKRIVRIATANIVMAIGIKLLVLVLSALGFVSLWLAVFADVGVTLLAVLNSLRALTKKRW